MDWHTRYTQQATWTQSLRQYAYQLAGLSSSWRILDVGCGTGALLPELSAAGSAFGIDIDPSHINMAIRTKPQVKLTCGDAHQLPYSENTFDLCLCHYVLLWLKDPPHALQEMQRVTRPGGWVFALAEPDYLARIDYPPELQVIGDYQRESLFRQGANPGIGRKLAALFTSAGMDLKEVGVLGAQWTMPTDPDQNQIEWQVLISDLSDRPEQLAGALQLRKIDEESWLKGTRIMYVPTFFAFARKQVQEDK